ncbi:MAG: DUF1460 domain-containing protein [Candidatus Azobacteroides sp.]|nr:DUF1460 domain-containing protein [Candidatus Azobacteroides sp.]
MNTKIIALFFCLQLFCIAKAQIPVISSDIYKDEQIFNSYLQKINHIKKSSPDSSLIQTALFFLDTPYQANTLEGNQDEQLIINLRGLDCMTFVETCMALTRTIRSDNPIFETYKKELQTIRYRDGIIAGYTSRLHYTSDWIKDNQKKGIINDKTKAAGGIILPLQINFMSTNPHLYAHLSTHPEDVKKMRYIENSINKRTYYYIPKEEIKNIEKNIQTGDIICFVTSTKGLDISHLGIAYRKDNMLTFIHASTKAQKVIINPESIADYCHSIKSNKGIIILKLL